MTFQLLIISMIMLLNTQEIYDFSKDKDVSDWRIINDGIMGGVSRSSFELDTEGNAVFSGSVSLDYNGGFCSVRHNFKRINLEKFKTIEIRLKGDGKRYQFRIRHNSSDYYSYITYFVTDGEWQNIQLKLNEMYPSFRGRKLDMGNFDKDSMEEIAFLIGNKKEEKFRLVIDKIELK